MKMYGNEVSREFVEECIEKEPVAAREMTMKEKVKAKAKKFWKKNGDKIIIGGFYTLLIGGTALYAIHGYKQERAFNDSIMQMYGPKVREGNLLGGPIKKRWAAHKKWEEEGYEDNFNKVVDFVKSMNLKDNEYYSIDNVVGDNGENIIEVMQMLDGGFYHGELI